MAHSRPARDRTQTYPVIMWRCVFYKGCQHQHAILLSVQLWAGSKSAENSPLAPNTTGSGDSERALLGRKFHWDKGGSQEAGLGGAGPVSVLAPRPLQQHTQRGERGLMGQESGEAR